MSHSTLLRKDNLKRETSFILLATQDNDININYAKVSIEKTQ